MPTIDDNNTQPSTAVVDPTYPAALETLRQRIMEMPADQLMRETRLDVNASIDVAESTARKVARYRAELVALCGEAIGKLVDDLPLVARAARQADIELGRVPTSGDLSAMHKRVSAGYQLVMTDAQSMANRGLIDAKDLEPARDIQGYQALLRSTFIVVSLLREKWAQIQGSSPLTLEDIERTRQDAEKMQIALALRDGGANQAPAAELRMRAFSLLIRHYDQVRRAVSYLRWNEDDADTIAPSFWAGRGRKPRTETPLVEPSTPEPATPEAPVDPATPGAGPMDPTAPGGPFAS